ncbi:MAG: hypothetical protein HY892_16600 [Deltaproteobacteria bacterium]|nr:hypothetical protein [Deltaproteobacteria bacterium]
MKRIISFVFVLATALLVNNIYPNLSFGAPVGDDIPIQGRLTDSGGNPLTGTFSMTFALYDDPVEGNLMCLNTDTVTVVNGLFNTMMDNCTVSDISGLQLYLGIKVGSDPEMTPRQKIGQVPYASSLRAGARGMAKAGVYANCGWAGSSSIVRSFNNENSAVVTISPGEGMGTCRIDFGFNISQRYWTAIPPMIGPRFATCYYDPSDPNDVLTCSRENGNGIRENGPIIVIVY